MANAKVTIIFKEGKAMTKTVKLFEKAIDFINELNQIFKFSVKKENIADFGEFKNSDGFLVFKNNDDYEKFYIEHIEDEEDIIITTTLNETIPLVEDSKEEKIGKETSDKHYIGLMNIKHPQILKLDLSNFILDQNKFKIPSLHETWTWEGDESILPYKWTKLIKQSQIHQIIDDASFNQVKEKLKKNYYGKPDFDKKSFFFITYRSEVAASAYLNINNQNTVEYFAINPKYMNRGVNYGLFYLIYNRAVLLKIKELRIDTKLTNENKEFFLGIGFS